MLLSKSCEYAVRAAIYVAKRSLEQKKTSIAEISEQTGAPLSFTGKILQILVKEKVISSVKGPNGGFYIQDSSSVYLIDILKAMDGDGLFTQCAFGLEQCSNNRPCPLHSQIIPIRTELFKLFSNKTIADLVDGVDQQLVFLK